MRHLLLAISYTATLATTAVTAVAQSQQDGPPLSVASSFATTEVRLIGRPIQNGWMTGATAMEGPSRIAIAYGQPHLRGRALSAIVPNDQVWRLGSNVSTTLHTDVDITLGGANIPHGIYSLYALRSEKGWTLIVNTEVTQWGTEYTPSKDLVRIPLRSRAVNDPVESLTMYLVPNATVGKATGAAQGTLKIVWEKVELSADWEMGLHAKP